MSLLTCAAAGCTETFQFNPINPCKKFCSLQCGIRTRVARKRKRDKLGGGGDGGGGKQRRLFSRPMLAESKPPKPAPVAEPTLFENDLLHTFGGPIEYAPDGSVSDKQTYSRYSVKSGSRKPSVPVQPAIQPSIPGEKHAA